MDTYNKPMGVYETRSIIRHLKMHFTISMNTGSISNT